MNIVIVGCGKVGFTLARTLVNEGHNVVVVDKNEKQVNYVTSILDCMGIVGNGAMQNVLDDASINQADFLIATTDSDEINILTCLFASKVSKCKSIARIRDVEYTRQMRQILKELDISMIINPEMATANEILRILRYSSALSSDSFFKGHLNLIKVDIPNESQIFGTKLFQIPIKFKCNLLVCAIERNNDVIIPTGITTIEKDDKIYFVADRDNVFKFFDVLGYKYKKIDSCMIVGGGKISQYLIENISNKSNMNIKVIDTDNELCKDLALKYPYISILNCDATDKNILIKEGLNDVDAFIALTGIDEQNIILSLYASKNSNNMKVIAKINHLNFVDSLKEIEVGSIVNPERIASNIISKYVRGAQNTLGSNIETLYKICDDRAEAIEFKIDHASDVTGKELKSLNLKKNVLIVGIFRDNKIIIPKGTDMIKEYDSVVVISKDNQLNEILDIIDKQ